MTLRPPKFATEEPPFELKGSLFTLTVMHLRQADKEVIRYHLAETIKRAPGFFRNTPVVIDLDTLKEPAANVDFVGLYGLLRQQGMIPIGVRHGSTALQAGAVLAGLAVLPDGRAVDGLKKSATPQPNALARSKLINQPVRSGQQIYAPAGDLIVLGAVSAGAEVLADGNIHIYGPLRGRALAGVKGDAQAHIFCQNLEAELVSIAGQYRVIEQVDELEPEVRGKAVQIYLLEDRLIIKPIVG